MKKKRQIKYQNDNSGSSVYEFVHDKNNEQQDLLLVNLFSSYLSQTLKSHLKFQIQTHMFKLNLGVYNQCNNALSYFDDTLLFSLKYQLC